MSCRHAAADTLGIDSLFGPSRSSRSGGSRPAASAGPVSGYCAVVLHRGIERKPVRSGGDGESTGGRPGQPPSHPPAPDLLVDTALTYAIPASMAPITGPNALVIGRLVRVPLGKSDKVATGVVVAVGGAELLGTLSPSRIKPLVELLPAAMAPSMLELGRWLGGYYVCPLGMVLQSMLPAAVKRAVGRKLTIYLQPVPPGPHRTEAEAKLTSKQRAIWDEVLKISSEHWPLPAKAVAPLTKASGPMIKKLTAMGLLLTIEHDGFVAHSSPHAAALQAAAGPEAPEGPEGLDAIGAAAGPASAGQPALRPRLTEPQRRVVDALAGSLGSFGVHLIRGVTGSGKTEVYLSLIERMLAADSSRTALVLVPEIALTPQTSRRFLGRFGSDSVAVLHSGLTSSQRSSEWSRASTGTVKLVVGARSAVFAPLPNLGLVVVDEEHDTSYKQDQLPRYHARDVAIKRAQLEGCPIVLGSATPSLESWYNAITPASPGAKPRYTLHELGTRATGAPMPDVQIVDLREERKLRASGPEGWSASALHLIGPTLEAGIARTLAAGGQVMLLLNRRGYANYICCPDPKCGYVLHCDHCDATMVYHRAGVTSGYVRCHHCLTELLPPTKCPLCTRRLNTFGMGTQRVEEELERKFLSSHGIVSGQTMLRADSDTMASGNDYFDTLDRFAAGEVRILLGTQMIAKGLDFPNVQLVGIINADTALDMPDFRASERTFQLVSQVAGRAGRGTAAGGTFAAGKVIVQTMSPQAPAVVLAQKHDFVTFAAQELLLRQRVGLPPVGKMARVICRDLIESKARDRALEAYNELERHAGEVVLLRGPMACAISRIDDHYRFAVELTAMSRGEIQRVLAAARAAGLLVSDHQTAVDVDPVALL